MSKPRYSDPFKRAALAEKRAAKRARQRAAGYQGVKKKSPPAVMQHNGGRDVGGRCSKDARFASEPPPRKDGQ